VAGSLLSDAASSDSTASSTAQPQQLAFEQDCRFKAQNQWEYENKLRTHIKDRVSAKLANDCTTVLTRGWNLSGRTADAPEDLQPVS
jgi:hypothetical protein